MGPTGSGVEAEGLAGIRARVRTRKASIASPMFLWDGEPTRCHKVRPFFDPLPPNPSCSFHCNGLSSITLYVRRT